MQLADARWVLVMGTLAFTTGRSPHQAGAQGPDHDRLAGITLQAVVSITDPASQMVDVQLQYAGLPQAADSFALEMSERHSFVKIDEPLIEGDLQVTGESGQSLGVKRVSPFRWTVQLNGSPAIRVKYRVPLRHRTLPQVRGRDEYEYPYLEQDHGMLVTATLFVTPEEMPLGPISVSFQLPEGWDLICPWPRGSDEAFHPQTERDLTYDLIAIGNWSRHTQATAGMTIDTLFAPGQEKLEQVAVPLIKEIVAAQLELFQVVPATKYLFLFGRPDTQGLGGSPKAGSMTLSVHPRIPAEMLRSSLSHLIAHEFHHLWTSSRFRCPDELRFFNEGFTDYYAYLLPARSQVIPWDEFYRTLGGCMANCESNPLNGQCSLTDAGGPRFFSDSNARDLVYQGGLLAAAALDARLRASDTGKTLDDLMRTFNNDPRWSLRGPAPTLDDFLGCVATFVSPDDTAHIRQLLAAPYSLDPETEFPPLGVTVTRTTRPPSLRLRGNLLDDRPTVLRDLDPKGLAYRLGVRPGDRFVKINGSEPVTREDVYKAWSNPAGERVSVTIDRSGEQVLIDQPIPDEVVYAVAGGSWQER